MDDSRIATANILLGMMDGAKKTDELVSCLKHQIKTKDWEIGKLEKFHDSNIMDKYKRETDRLVAANSEKGQYIQKLCGQKAELLSILNDVEFLTLTGKSALAKDIRELLKKVKDV